MVDASCKQRYRYGMRYSLLRTEQPKSTVSLPVEGKGVVYTKPWVVDLILDLAAYRSDIDLTKTFAIEPAAGNGAFLISMAVRLIAW